MQIDSTQRPVILCLGGHDPVGGAGIQADIETVAALGGHAVTAITCLTVQDSRDVRSLHPVSPGLFRDQIEAVLADVTVQSAKIGLIGEATLVPVIASILGRHRDIPVVLDPVLAAGGGTVLARSSLTTTISEQLVPLAHLVTPNLHEARRLTDQVSADECAASLMAKGCRNVLITGTDIVEDDRQVINRLYTPAGADQKWHWARLPNSYHGSGCTLASACATLLAQGQRVADAASHAQEFTYQALQQGWRPGHGQHLPWRRC